MEILKKYMMNYFHNITVLAILLLLYSACTPDRESGTASNGGDTLSLPPDLPAAAGALNYYGTYTGTIPCASCPGIEMHLTLQEDNHFILEQRYLEEDGPSLTEAGKYIVKDNIVRLKAGEDSTFYWLAENRVYMLDKEMQRIEGTLADAYILQKNGERPLEKNFSGSYATETPARSYSQTLTITATGKEKYEVSFSAPEFNGSPGCNFTGEGRVEHDTLKIFLKKAEKAAIMVLVRRDNQTLEVFTEEEKDGHALMEYCTGGATLAGSYQALKTYAL